MNERGSAVRDAAERAAREAYGRLLARLTRRTSDIAAAEDALSHAFAKALATWPATGVPAAPEAWLSTTARNALIDGARRAHTAREAAPTLRLLMEERAGDLGGDERLSLIFAASHPAIASEVHAPLILQTVFGVSAREMAPAFMIPASAISQRLVRAKAKIKAAGVPFDPDPVDRTARLFGAQSAIYALYTLAAAAPPSAEASARAADAAALAALLAELAGGDPETLGLAALIAFSKARAPARRVEGRYVQLSRQDVSLWSAPLIAEGERLLRVASGHRKPGRFQLEAAIQSVHCDRLRTGRTNHPALAVLYDALVALHPTIGAEVARAAAHAEVHGAAAGLALLAAVPAERAARYQPYWAVRAHLERGTGASGADALERAIGLADDEAVRSHLAALRQ